MVPCMPLLLRHHINHVQQSTQNEIASNPVWQNMTALHMQSKVRRGRGDLSAMHHAASIALVGKIDLSSVLGGADQLPCAHNTLLKHKFKASEQADRGLV